MFYCVFEALSFYPYKLSIYYGFLHPLFRELMSLGCLLILKTANQISKVFAEDRVLKA